MVVTPYLFKEIIAIFQNTSDYIIVLETLLLLSVMWIIFHNRDGRSFYISGDKEITVNYEPEKLMAIAVQQHSFLKTHLIRSKVGKNVSVDDYHCLNLATHNYLGLLEDKQILENACRCIRKYGVGSCGPRGFYGTMDVHLELEERLASFMKVEDSVVYSYGFSTISSAIPAYSKRGDIIFVDEAVNFAIQKGLDASRSTVYFYKHNDIADLERLLREQAKRDEKNSKKTTKSRRFIIAEGIYLNTGEICPLPELVTLRSTHKLRLFLDESVSFGTLGKTGRGVTEHFNINRSEIDLIAAAMEWTVGAIGGFCVGSHFIVEHQRLSGLGYCFSASLPPLLAESAISSLKRLESEPQIFMELRKISVLMNSKFSTFSKLKLGGNKLSPVKHLYISENRDNREVEHELLNKVCGECISRGIAVVQACYLYKIEGNPIRPSIRITANRLLTVFEIDYAFKVIEEVSNEIL